MAPAPPPRPAPAGARTARTALLAAVGLAGADASIVALALPEVYGEMGASVVGVSWVLTAYALAAALTAAALAGLPARVRLGRLAVLAGLVAFAIGSAWCGVAGDLGWLVAGRVVQGVGAALTSAAALAVLADRASPGAGPGRAAARAWNRAATVGLAVGPAVGGLVTQLATWRAIFLVQAPLTVLAAALVVARRPAPVPVPAPAGADHGPAGPDDGSSRRAPERLAAHTALLLLSAALVGVLFLAVLLLVVVWGYPPLGGAAVVSALPAGMALARLGVGGSARLRVGGGAAVVAAGLAALALLPGEQPVLAAAALAVCGVGLDLVGEALGPRTLPADAPPGRSAAVSVALRHGGLVLGLLLVAPVLSAALDAGTDRAVLRATGALLDAPVDIRDKVTSARALQDAVRATPRGEVPDVARVFAGLDDDSARRVVSADVRRAVVDALTRAFRPAYAVAALLALAVVAPARLLAGPVRGGTGPAVGAAAPGRPAAALVVTGGLVAAAVLVGVSLGRDALDVGTYRPADACRAGPPPEVGGGLDGALQRVALGALDGAACELGTSRERLVLSLDPDAGYADVRWDRPTIERAVRAGALRAIDDADRRGDLPGLLVGPLRAAVERAPIDWFTGGLPDLPELPELTWPRWLPGR